jgi:futalosine hydrolase
MAPTLLVVCATAAERDAAAQMLPARPVSASRAAASASPVSASPVSGSAVSVSPASAPPVPAGVDLLRAETATGTVDLLVGGVGVAAAAATTSAALAGGAYDMVISAGIAGGFAPVAIGATVVASAVVHADLGAEDGAEFRPSSTLGLGPERHELDPALVTALVTRSRLAGEAVTGAVLTVSTVTGSAATAAARRSRCPDAVAEAMEGAGVLAAAQVHGVAFAEIRAISNVVGPRDRAAWRIGPALSALGSAIAAITAAPLPSTAALTGALAVGSFAADPHGPFAATAERLSL